MVLTWGAAPPGFHSLSDTVDGTGVGAWHGRGASQVVMKPPYIICLERGHLLNRDGLGTFPRGNGIKDKAKDGPNEEGRRGTHIGRVSVCGTWELKKSRDLSGLGVGKAP